MGMQVIAADASDGVSIKMSNPTGSKSVAIAFSTFGSPGVAGQARQGGLKSAGMVRFNSKGSGVASQLRGDEEVTSEENSPRPTPMDTGSYRHARTLGASTSR